MALRIDDLTAFGRHIADLDLTATSAPGQIKARFSSSQTNGDVTWESAGRGKLTARLGKLQLESSSLEPTAEVSQKATDELPALDVTADDFSLGTRRFGKLELQARNESGVWRLDRVALTNPVGEFAGSGQWQPGVGKNRTQIAFKVESSDTGKLLDRLGYPGTVKGGTAHLDGNLAWAGSPVDFDYGTLSGDMKVEVSKGQFLKADPGVGKLLGLLSLQGVVRRLTFDFNDVFGKGFAFDTVAAKAKVDNGVMHTDRLQIDGPAARVLMSGDVDLKRETQRLNVKIQPEMGGTAALGVGIVNPVAGVATWVAHKLLQNPLNQIFSYEYLITGTWDEPDVEKKSHPPAAGTGDPANSAAGASAPATGSGQ